MSDGVDQVGDMFAGISSPRAMLEWYVDPTETLLATARCVAECPMLGYRVSVAIALADHVGIEDRDDRSC